MEAETGMSVISRGGEGGQENEEDKKKRAGKTRGERSWKCEKVERSLIGRKEGEGFLFRPPSLPSGLSGGYNA